MFNNIGIFAYEPHTNTYTLMKAQIHRSPFAICHINVNNNDNNDNDINMFTINMHVGFFPEVVLVRIFVSYFVWLSTAPMPSSSAVCVRIYTMFMYVNSLAKRLAAACHQRVAYTYMSIS